MLPDKTLVIVPHPDDEVLLAAGIISRLVKEKKAIWAAIVTNGDYLCTNCQKGSRRLEESLSALKFLGMKEEDIFFLGYPDTGMKPENSFLTRLLKAEHGSLIYPSPSSHVTYGIIRGKQDYSMERKCRHNTYCRDSLEEDLYHLVDSLMPNLVITTSSWDVHGDHSGLSVFMKKILANYAQQSNRFPILWEGLVHSPAGDDSWPLSACPNILDNSGINAATDTPDNPDTNASANALYNSGLDASTDTPDNSDIDASTDTPDNSSIDAASNSRFTMPKNLDLSTGLIWSQRIQIPLLKEDIRQERKKQAIFHYHTALNPTEPSVIRYLLSFAKEEEIFWQTDYFI